MKYQGQILRKDCQFSQINSNLLISIFTGYATLGRLSVICYLYALWIRKILVKLTLRKVFEASNPFFHCLYWKEQKINSINCQLETHTHERGSPDKFIFFCMAQRKCAFTQSLWPTSSVDRSNFSHAWGLWLSSHSSQVFVFLLKLLSVYQQCLVEPDNFFYLLCQYMLGFTESIRA